MKRIIISALSFMILVSVLIPMISFAQAGDCPDGELCNPLSSGIDTLPKFVTAVLENIVLPIGAIVVVFFIIYSGFLFVTAQGSEDKLKDAKKTFLYTVIGAAVLLGSVAIAAAIQGTLCAIDASACAT